METSQITLEIFDGLFGVREMQVMLSIPLSLPGEPAQIPFWNSLYKIEEPISLYAGRTEWDDDLTQTIPGAHIIDGHRALLLMRYFPLRMSTYPFPVNRTIHPGKSSTAKVWFYRNDLETYFRHIILSLVESGISFNLDTAFLPIYLIISDLKNQAAYHNYCDQVRQLTRSNYNVALEREQAIRYSYHEIPGWQDAYAFMVNQTRFDSYFQASFHDERTRVIAEKRIQYIISYIFQNHFQNYWIKGLQVPFLHIENHLDEHIYNYLRNPVLDEMHRLRVPVKEKIGNPGHLHLTGVRKKLV